MEQAYAEDMLDVRRSAACLHPTAAAFQQLWQLPVSSVRDATACLRLPLWPASVGAVAD